LANRHKFETVINQLALIAAPAVVNVILQVNLDQSGIATLIDFVATA